jgi:oligosaccharyltransferase complex subunit delta (ribophorin II)
MRVLLTTLLIAATAQAAKLTVQSPRLTITDSTGSQLRSELLSLKRKAASPIQLEETDTLKLVFQIVDKESGSGVQPPQTFLRFYDEKSKEEGVQPVRVSLGGKAKFELNVKKPPLSLPPTPNSDPLKVSLIIGSAQYDPIAVDLFDLVLPKSHPAPEHPLESTFHVLPEIKHTFRPEHKVPLTFISAAFALIVLAPWVVLVGLWSQVAPTPSRLFSPSVFPFIATLGAFEVLLFWYWVDMKLGQVLLYGGILSIPTFFAGKAALASIGSHRVGRK